MDSDESFVKIAEEGSDDIMEVPIEKNGTVLLSTVQAQFTDAIGLKYKSSSGGWRGIRAVDQELNPPSGGWGETTYYINQSGGLKRKSSQDNNGRIEESKEKSRKSANLLQDMVVFGLPYTATNEELKEYFTKSCGELSFGEVKFDRQTKKSRGFGFIRFKTEEGAREALKGNHRMQGRTLEIQISKKKVIPLKLFVGRLPTRATREDVTEYFSQYGELDDIFVPSPARGFAFITYASQDDGNNVVRMNHVLQGAQLNVTIAAPKEEKPRDSPSYGQSDYNRKPSSDRSSGWNPDRNYDRNGDRNRDRTSDRYDMDDEKKGGYGKSDRSQPRNDDRDIDRNSGRYDSRFESRGPPQKDMASELKNMLFTLLNNSRK